MGFIRTILSLIIVLAIIVFGYWLYATYTGMADDKIWGQINTYLPEPLHSWSCDKITQSGPAGAPRPAGC